MCATNQRCAYHRQNTVEHGICICVTHDSKICLNVCGLVILGAQVSKSGFKDRCGHSECEEGRKKINVSATSGEYDSADRLSLNENPGISLFTINYEQMSIQLLVNLNVGTLNNLKIGSKLMIKKHEI